MDDLDSSFGRLSTSAAEWRPGGGVVPPQNPPTEKLASSTTTVVKEFVPGLGWTANPSPLERGGGISHGKDGEQVTDDYQHDSSLHFQEHEEQHVHYEDNESTVPSGPYPPPLPELPSFRGLHSLGLSDSLWTYYRNLALDRTRQMEPTDPRHHGIPVPYCNAYVLGEETNRDVFGHPSTVFQVTHRHDGHLYCLRRFDTVRSVSAKIASTVLSRWTMATNPNHRLSSPDGASSPLQNHPNIVPLSQCFVAQRAVFFVHHFVDGAQTLKDRFCLDPRIQRKPPRPPPILHHSTATIVPTLITEAVLWSVITQVVSAIQAVHTNHLAVQTLDWQHVLISIVPVSSSSSSSSSETVRVRLGCVGIMDALEFESRKPVVDLQREDLRRLGRLILSLCTGTCVTAATTSDANLLRQCQHFASQHFSAEVVNLCMTLIQSGSVQQQQQQQPPLSIVDVSRALSQRLLDEQETAYRALDRTTQALAAEYDSGRAMRLMLKLAFVNERPEFGHDRRWSQSGDCYILMLFRDFVFHQADGAGYPVMDLGHVVTALNKLDAASEEQIVLASRDGHSLLVVTYADVARCLEAAFAELASAAVPPSVVPC
jgi:PAB-dependent poly(A)-specific ribonuclease subunit 3